MKRASLQIWVLLLFLVLILAGCGKSGQQGGSQQKPANVKDLNRENATKLIMSNEEVKDNKFKIYLPYYLRNDIYQIGGTNDSEIITFNKKLEEQGYLKIVPDPSPQLGGGGTFCQFTNKAQPFISKNNPEQNDPNKNHILILGEIEKVDVTGIKIENLLAATGKNENTKIARFLASYKTTPVGEFYSDKNIFDVKKGRAEFELWDDGWRLTRLDIWGKGLNTPIEDMD